MSTDALLTLATSQAVTTSAVTANTVDLQQARDLSAGTPLFLMFLVNTTVTAAGAATVNFQAITSAAAALTSPTVISQTDAIGKAELTAGRVPIFVPLGPAILTAAQKGQRYLGGNFLVGTGPLTAGAFSVYVVPWQDTYGKYYPSGFSVT